MVKELCSNNFIFYIKKSTQETLQVGESELCLSWWDAKFYTLLQNFLPLYFP